MLGVEQRAEIRRWHRVEGVSIREIGRRMGLHRKTVRRALAAAQPPRYSRPASGSKVDPVRDWICEQLAAEPRIPSQRLREMATEMGYEGGKAIFDDYARDVRPRFLAARTFSGRFIGRASLCSAICGNRESRSRSVTASAVAVGW